jgi:hypothetical protein
MTEAEEKIISMLSQILEILQDVRPRKAKQVALKNNILRVISEHNMEGHVRENKAKTP